MFTTAGQGPLPAAHVRLAVLEFRFNENGNYIIMHPADEQNNHK